MRFPTIRFEKEMKMLEEDRSLEEFVTWSSAPSEITYVGEGPLELDFLLDLGDGVKRSSRVSWARPDEEGRQYWPFSAPRVVVLADDAVADTLNALILRYEDDWSPAFGTHDWLHMLVRQINDDLDRDVIHIVRRPQHPEAEVGVPYERIELAGRGLPSLRAVLDPIPRDVAVR
jgi:hypothetical protein